MAWTDDRVQKLRDMWGEGQSASMIATALGGVTRNAVIGKVHRLGLSGRDRTGTGAAAKAASAKAARPSKPRQSKPRATPRRTTASKTAKPAARKTGTPQSKPMVEPVSRARTMPSAPRIPQALQDMANRPFQAPQEGVRMANGKYATVMTITDHMCKWPLGDPGAEDFRFCGRRTDEDEPYCMAHSRVAYQPSRRRGGSNKSLPPVLRRKAIR